MKVNVSSRPSLIYKVYVESWRIQIIRSRGRGETHICTARSLVKLQLTGFHGLLLMMRSSNQNGLGCSSMEKGNDVGKA